jgi:death on curing protein
MEREPIWIGFELAEAIHVRQIAEHGSSDGIRDRGLLESALAKPRQRLIYEQCDLQTLAAAYAYGIARNHPFVDGNKRTAYVVCRTFLILNGWDIVGPLTGRYTVFMELAAGKINEDNLTVWLRNNTRPLSVSESAGSYG